MMQSKINDLHRVEHIEDMLSSSNNFKSLISKIDDMINDIKFDPSINLSDPTTISVILDNFSNEVDSAANDCFRKELGAANRSVETKDEDYYISLRGFIKEARLLSKNHINKILTERYEKSAMNYNNPPR